MRKSSKSHSAAGSPIDGVAGSTPVKPQRSRLKPEAPKDENPAAGKPERRKSVVPRRAPSRGKYIDEYANPPGC